MDAWRISCVLLIAMTGSLNLRAGAIAEVPFDYHRGEILVAVRIGETGPWTMMVDTGTDPSVVDSRVAVAAGLFLRAPEGAIEGGGTENIEVMETTIPELRLGDLVVGDLAAAVLDLTPLSKRLGRSLDGIIGHSLLENRVVQIDYPGHRLAFLDGSPEKERALSADRSRLMVCSFVYNEGVIIQAVRINGKQGRGLIDTGSNGGFKMAPAAVAAFGLEADLDRAVGAESTGFRGVSQNRSGTIEEIAVGPFVQSSPKVVFFGAGMGRDDVPWDLNIGNDFLEDFVLTIDYPGRRVRLERPPPAEPAGADDQDPGT